MKNKKLIALVCCMALLVGAVGATLAWLTDKTGEVKNTFTVGNINIDLYETEGAKKVMKKEYKMVPGDTLDKDPKVTVESNSEECWLFVTVEKTGGDIKVTKEDGSEENYTFDDFITYSVITGENGWTMLSGENNEGVFYRKVAMDKDNPQHFDVIKDANGTVNKVTVNSTITKEMMDALFAAGENKYPDLVFKAYAIQQANLEYGEAKTDTEKAAVAWAVLNAPVEP